MRGCLVLAVQADGRRVETIETPSPSPRLRALREAFVARNALQCGYCTGGMLMAAPIIQLVWQSLQLLMVALGALTLFGCGLAWSLSEAPMLILNRGTR